MKEIRDLSKEELLDLLIEYDSYIQQANEEYFYGTGWLPVCISEFYTNEYQLVLEERDKCQ